MSVPRFPLPGVLHVAASIMVSVPIASLVAGCSGTSRGVAGGERTPWYGEEGEGGRLVEVSGEYGRRRNAARILEMPRRSVSRTMSIGSRAAYLHESPDVRSRPIALLCAGDSVSVVREAEFIRMPRGCDMREYVGPGAGRVTPTWVQVDCGAHRGWVPARALVDPAVLADADPTFGVASAAEGDPVAIDGFLARAMPPAWFGDDADPFAAASPPEVPRAGAGTRAGGHAEGGSGPRRKDPLPASLAAMDRLSSELGIQGSADPGNRTQLQWSMAVLQMAETHGPRPCQPHERLFGRECLARRLSGTTVLPPDHPASRYVRWLGWRIAAPSSLPYPSSGFAFAVAQDDRIDIVGVPGGPVLVTTGLLQVLGSEDQLAAVLACEVARVEAREGLSIAQSHRVFSIPDPELLRRMAALPSASQAPGSAEAAAAAARLAVLRAHFEDSLSAAVDDAVGTQTARSSHLAIRLLLAVGPMDALPARAMSLSCAAGFDPSSLAAAADALRRADGSGRFERRLRSTCSAQLIASMLVALPPESEPDPAAAARWERLQSSVRDPG